MKELKHYYRQVSAWLPCGGRLKKQLMSSITATVDGYLAEHPEADFAALQAHFGSPQQIASAFVDEMETEELLNALRIRRKSLALFWASQSQSLQFGNSQCCLHGYSQFLIFLVTALQKCISLTNKVGP